MAVVDVNVYLTSKNYPKPIEFAEVTKVLLPKIEESGWKMTCLDSDPNELV